MPELDPLAHADRQQGNFRLPGSPSQGSALPTIPLGYFSDLVTRKNCQFCTLASSSVLDCLDTDEESFMQICIDGYGEFPRICGYPMTRAFCKLGNVEKEDSGVYSLRLWITEDHRFFDGVRAFDFQRLSEDQEPWQGRPVEDTISDCVLLTWVAMTTLLDKPMTLDNTVLQHFRLIDVEDKCVVKISEPRRYLALSYVWGGKNFLRNTKSLVKDFEVPGVLDTMSVPRTIADAMTVTARVGVRFLWVDSLCIVQDDDIAKSVQIPVMGQIYSSAVVTLVAASGAHADFGLPGVRSFSRKSFQHRSNNFELFLGSCVDNYSTYSPNTRLPADVWDQVLDSGYNKRAWTFQEFWLSDVSIVFLDRIALCLHEGHVWQEDIWEDDVDGSKDASVSNQPPSYRKSLRSMFDVTHKLAMVNTSRYDMALRLYSGRKLSFDEDAINAISALLSLMRPVFRGDYLYGLPSTELEFSMLWRPEGSLRQRSCAARRNQGSKTPKFPSWSWAAWDGEICMPPPKKRFSRVLWFNHRDNFWFTSEQYRGFTENLPKGWIQMEKNGDRYYSELDNPYALFLHPVAAESIQSGRNGNFLLPGNHVLMFRAWTGRLPMHPGRWCMERLKDFNFRHLSPNICSYTLRDLLGPDRVAGVVYLHTEQLPMTPVTQPYELVVISRSSHYRLCDKETKDPPSDDCDLLAGVKHYVWEEQQRNLLNNAALTDWQRAQIRSQFDEEIHWGIYDVFVVEWVGDIAYRVGVGVCYARAFHFARPQWKTIFLG